MIFVTGILSLGMLITGGLLLIPGFTSPVKDKRGHTISGSIASLEAVDVGGTRQWILIRGFDVTKPLILFLHGGPGTSNMCLLRKYTTELGAIQIVACVFHYDKILVISELRSENVLIMAYSSLYYSLITVVPKS